MHGVIRLTFVMGCAVVFIGVCGTPDLARAQQATPVSPTDTTPPPPDTVAHPPHKHRPLPPNLVPSGEPDSLHGPMAGITLDSTQRARLQAVNALYTPKLIASAKTLSKAGHPPPASMLAAAKSLYGDYIAALRNVLTPAQQAVFDQNQATIQATVAATKANLDAWKSAQ